MEPLQGLVQALGKQLPEVEKVYQCSALVHGSAAAPAFGYDGEVDFETLGREMGHRYPKRNQLKYTKQRYRVRNWLQYEAGLRKRGDLTLWFSEEAIVGWQAPTGHKPGGQPVYSDLAIEAALTVRLVYGLALRQTEGFLQSIFALLDLGLPKPPTAPAMADGAYDTSSVYAAIEAYGPGPPPQILISPRRDAQTRSGTNAPSQRNATVRAIGAVGRRRWVHESGYTRRSLVEAVLSRYKTMIGGIMRSRTMTSQKTEAALACAILNRKTHLGMPDGYCIA